MGEVTDDTLVRIETAYGNIDVVLFNETPLHRDNFIKLINEGYYDNLLFHRVINNFMIQGGDPESRDAGPAVQLGSGGPGYTIPAEFHEKLFHQKGALAAARQGDNVNPEKESSGSQFYIVHGTVFTEEQLEGFENQINNNLIKDYYSRRFREMESEYLDRGAEPDYNAITEKIKESIADNFSESNRFRFSDKQIELYTTIGGTPHLDGSYTVFGKTVEGFDVIDKIASASANNSSRPVDDIKMKIKLIKNE